jgi:cytochrome c5
MLKANLTAFIFLLVLPHVGLSQARGPAPTSAEMVKKMETTCTACHTPSLIAQQRLDRAGWTREMDKMIRWGAVVSDADKDALINYFARSFTPNRPVPNSFKTLPAGKGVDLVQTYCLSCHNDTLIAARKLDRAGWSAQVDEMVKWGAYVPATRRDELLDYLAAHFGK